MVLSAAKGAAIGTPIGCAMGGAIDYDDLLNYAIGCGAGAIVGAYAGAAFYQGAPPPPPPAPPEKEKLMLSGGGPFSGRSARATPPTRPPKEKLTLRGVHFDYNKADIRPEDEALLDEAADTLNAHPSVTIYVDGYCDATGTDDYNQKLAQQRAQAVANYLVGKGVDRNRLIARGFGRTHFVAPNDTDDGRAQNRRVELVPAG